MTKPQRIRPKGATQYDLLGMNDEDFEAMAARLIRLEYPHAFKPSNRKDGGADMALPREGGGYERCWQAKHFTGDIKWEQREKSLNDAVENWADISEYTFVFPRELSNREQKTFDRKFRSNDATVEVNYWEGDRLQHRLTGSDAGRRVAKTFFDDVALDRENLNRAIEVGGRLDTIDDALDRLGNIGGFLASTDAYFSYPGATHEVDEPGPPPSPGAVMSIADIGAITRRVDIVPRDDEAMERYGPELQLDAAEGEAGQRAAAKLLEALRERKEVEIGEGLDVTFTRLPPAFGDLVGRKLTGATVQLGRPKRIRPHAAPFRARLEANTDRGSAAVELKLRQADTVPDGWDDSFVGRYGGMTVTQLFRRVGTGGEIHWNLRHQRDKSSVQKQLTALKFIAAAAGSGELAFTRLGGADATPLRTSTKPVPLNAATEALIAFLDDLRAIEEWTDVEYDLPEEPDVQELRAVHQVASIIRTGGVSGTWQHFEFVVDDEGVRRLGQGGVLRVEREAGAALLGRFVQLGCTRLDIPAYTVSSVEPAGDEPGRYTVRLTPPDEEAASVFEHLIKAATTAEPARPPPPPPKRKRPAGRKKRKR